MLNDDLSAIVAGIYEAEPAPPPGLGARGVARWQQQQDRRAELDRLREEAEADEQAEAAAAEQAWNEYVAEADRRDAERAEVRRIANRIADQSNPSIHKEPN